MDGKWCVTNVNSDRTCNPAANSNSKRNVGHISHASLMYAAGAYLTPQVAAAKNGEKGKTVTRTAENLGGGAGIVSTKVAARAATSSGKAAKGDPYDYASLLAYADNFSECDPYGDNKAGYVKEDDHLQKMFFIMGSAKRMLARGVLSHVVTVDVTHVATTEKTRAFLEGMGEEVASKAVSSLALSSGDLI